MEVTHPSPDRVVPPCAYFTDCGGCQLQHWHPEPYLQWKRQLILKQLEKQAPSLLRDVEIETIPLLSAPRRRVSFAVMRNIEGIKFGFHKYNSHDIVDIEQCFISASGINEALPALRSFLGGLVPSGKKISCLVTLADNGLDINVTADWQLNEKQRLSISQRALPPGLIRFTWQKSHEGHEPLILIEQPKLELDDILVELPPGSFLQPSLDGEREMRRLVSDAVKKAKQIADLYSGIGTFALPLARAHKIYAADITRDSIEALQKAARRSELHGKIRAERRDLHRSPLSLEELEDFDAVIFDPPRAGSLLQCQLLARSRVAKIIAISCFPASFAKDAQALEKGGYRLQRLVLIDQFRHSHHVEIFASFYKH